jgi:hypothetical protein
MRYVVSVLALLALTAIEAQAQEDASSHHPSLSISLFGGGFVPGSKFTDGAKFTSAGTIGGAVTLWPARHLGVRGSVLRTKSEAEVPTSSNTPLEGQNPALWFYSVDAVLQPSIEGVERWGWSPYLFAGVGAKRYGIKEGTNDGFYALTGDLGAGLEYRVRGSWGLQAEARHYLSHFERFQYDQKQRDWIFTGGLVVKI